MRRDEVYEEGATGGVCGGGKDGRVIVGEDVVHPRMGGCVGGGVGEEGEDGFEGGVRGLLVVV